MIGRWLWCDEQDSCEESNRCSQCPLNWTEKRRKWWITLSKRETELRELLAAWQFGQKCNKAMLNNGCNEDDREGIFEKIKENKILITALKHELERGGKTKVIEEGRCWLSNVCKYSCQNCKATFIDKDSNFRYCPYCGRRIQG